MQDFRSLDRQQWHQRYLEQAGWTEHIREYIFNKIEPDPETFILEVGSGTGAVLGALKNQGYHNLLGIDLDFPSLAYASKTQQTITQFNGNGYHLPFRTNLFDITLSHYLLMWTAQPALILSEMRRVTQPGGWVLALAEPDHQSRIDYPPELVQLGKYQTQSLEKQGADISLGRKLRALFVKSGLVAVETGILSAQWTQREITTLLDTEWAMIQADLEDRLSEQEIAEYQQLDQAAQKTGTRVLFIPTFYAFGKVP